ncbi:hypothetical protein GOV12_08220 [Candidatus Pacearchaeota archaeon]|nr:hypothetical protein [Candidatus Pacearchaeota archaeon]
MKISILFIVLFLAIVLFSTAIYFYTKNPNDKPIISNDGSKLTGKVTSDQTQPNNQDSDSNTVNTTQSSSQSSSQSSTSTSSSGGGGGGGSAGGGGGSSGSSPPPEDPEPEIILPDDAFTIECGYYYNDYGGFCNGTCAEGECVSVNRSCYCKR